MTRVIEEKRQSIIELCEHHHVARLEAFGSALRNDFDRAESDIDFLVELMPMEPYARVEAYFGLLEGLRALLGRQIDLVMVGAVKNPYIARQIQQTKQLLYAA